MECTEKENRRTWAPGGPEYNGSRISYEHALFQCAKPGRSPANPPTYIVGAGAGASVPRRYRPSCYDQHDEPSTLVLMRVFRLFIPFSAVYNRNSLRVPPTGLGGLKCTLCA